MSVRRTAPEKLVTSIAFLWPRGRAFPIRFGAEEEEEKSDAIRRRLRRRTVSRAKVRLGTDQSDTWPVSIDGR